MSKFLKKIISHITNLKFIRFSRFKLRKKKYQIDIGRLQRTQTGIILNTWKNYQTKQLKFQNNKMFNLTLLLYCLGFSSQFFISSMNLIYELTINIQNFLFLLLLLQKFSYKQFSYGYQILRLECRILYKSCRLFLAISNRGWSEMFSFLLNLL